MIMWYDVVVLGVLAFFALRGAMRGFIFQIASLAGIVLCFVFADAVSNALGPYVHLEPPMNHWVLMVASYLGFTLLCFLLARMLNEAIEKCKLKEFDRHLGVAFGLVKGVVLVMIATFFIVTVSESARASLKKSYTGRYCAIIMDRLEPILPHKLHVALEDYIHLLDSPDLPLLHSHDPFDHDGHDHGSDFQLGQPSTIPLKPIPNNTTPNASTPAGSLWGQLQGLFDSQSQQVISKALQNVDSQSRSQLEQKLNTVLSSIPPQERANLQQQIVEVGSSELQKYLDWKLSQLASPTSAPVPGMNSSVPSTTPPSPVQPIPNPSTPAPATAKTHQTLIQEIAGVYSPMQNIQQNIHHDIQTRIAGIPNAVSLAALNDWRSDLVGAKPDPDPKTGPDATVEIRILNQLQYQNVRIEQLSLEVQQRLRAAQAQSSSSQGAL